MQISRDRILALLQTSAAEFAGLVRPATPEQFRFVPAPGRWSIAENAEHLALAEAGSGKVIRGRLIGQESAPEVLESTIGAESRIERRLGRRDAAFPAPEIVVPTGRWPTVGEVMAVFEESRRATIEFLTTTRVDLTRYAYPHPALGPLNGWQWAYFLGMHVTRHCEQIREVQAAPGYPA